MSLPWLLSSLQAASPSESIRLSYNPGDGALFEVTERFDGVTTFTDQDPLTDVRERRSRLRVKRTNDGFAIVSTILTVVPTNNGRSVASPVFTSMADLELT